MKGTGLSKYLSYILRHGAIKEGYEMDEKGFVCIDEFLKRCTTTFDEIKQIVDTDNKKRFELIEKENKWKQNKWYIRAAQGHSIDLPEPGLKIVKDPSEIPIVVHGTNSKAYESIKVGGLNRMGRTHIHFSHGTPDDPTVVSGMRKSANVFIYIDVPKAMAAGIEFCISSNGVILSPGINGTIPPEYFADVIFTGAAKKKIMKNNVVKVT